MLDYNTDRIGATGVGFPNVPLRGHLWIGWEIVTRPDLNNRVISIHVHMVRDPARNAHNLRYRTAEGLGLGSTRTEIENVYGKANWEFQTRDRIFRWYASGISFMASIISMPTPIPPAILYRWQAWPGAIGRRPEGNSGAYLKRNS
ncbi:MAG: hypothetical protein RB148_02590, partial [Armatimonadota bacterium]|nr:hypothetical protein [Armatimonadota bacterium]